MLRPIQNTATRKAFFPAGVISLVLLPLLCLGYFTYNNSFQKYTMLEINFLSKKALEKMEPQFRFTLPKRSYHQIRLTGDVKGDRVKLDYVQLALREMIAKGDTVHGIHLVLQDGTKYSSLVRAIDIPNIEKLDNYWADAKKGFWFYVMPPPTEFDRLICGLSHCIVPAESKGDVFKSWLDNFKERINPLLQTPPLVFAFIGLALFNLLNLTLFLRGNIRSVNT